MFFPIVVCFSCLYLVLESIFCTFLVLSAAIQIIKFALIWLVIIGCRMLSSSETSSAPPPTHQAVNADLRRVTMETYWREVQSIEEERDGEEAEDEEEEERKSMDGEMGESLKWTT